MQMVSIHRQRGLAINDKKDTKTSTATSDQVKETQEIPNYVEGQTQLITVGEDRLMIGVQRQRDTIVQIKPQSHRNL
jgi:hypothetical protein